MGLGKIGPFFFHFPVFDRGAEFLESMDMEVDGARADQVAADGGDDDVFIGPPEQRADHQDGDAVGSGKALGNIGGFQFGRLNLD